MRTANKRTFSLYTKPKSLVLGNNIRYNRDCGAAYAAVYGGCDTCAGYGVFPHSIAAAFFVFLILIIAYEIKKARKNTNCFKDTIAPLS